MQRSIQKRLFKPLTILLSALLVAGVPALQRAHASTEEPTLTRDVNPLTQNLAGEDGRDIVVLNGTAYFFALAGLWKTDGTTDGTVLVKQFAGMNLGIGPGELHLHNGAMYFSADDGTSGSELWKSDGTASGTTLLKDIETGSGSSSPRLFTSVGTTLYFTATTSTTGYELWKSDGTSNGTVLVEDIRSGINDSMADNGASTMAALDANTLIFQANDGVVGRELWKTDGTSTTRLRDIHPSGNSIPSGMMKFGNSVYFSANDGTNGTELWKTDGTTTSLVQINANAGASSNPTFLTVFGDDLFLSADDGNGRELWKVAGSDGSLTRITNKFAVDGPLFITVFNSKMYFSAAASDGTTGLELWQSDGTDANTVLLKDIEVGANPSSPSDLVVSGGKLFFSARTDVTGQELWVSDGTSGGTNLAAEVVAGASGGWLPYPDPVLAAFGGGVLFTATTELYGIEMWISDGTQQGTKLLKDINDETKNGVTSDSELVSLDDIVLFEGTTKDGNLELWASDGTAAGTNLVKEIRAGGNSGSIRYMTRVGKKVYFQASNGTNNNQTPAQVGTELWVSDGTEAGTFLVKDIYLGTSSSSPRSFLGLGDTVFFRANDGTTDTELWKSNGTGAGTVLVKDIHPTDGSSPSQLTVVGSTLFFTADDGTNGRELWKSDGTEAGTVLVKDINPIGGSSPSQLTVVGSTLYFVASDGANGIELWKSDGTGAGTVLVKDINPGVGDSLNIIDYLTVLGETLFFVADDGTNGRELWKSDGTPGGTVIVKNVNVNPNTSSDIEQITALQDLVLFSAVDSSNDRELWVSDGTESGTRLLKNINPSSSSEPSNFGAAGTNAYFFASTPEHGKELWVTDGTENGTRLVSDLRPGTASSWLSYSPIVATSTRVFFMANNGRTGEELWTITYENSNLSSPITSVPSRPYEGPLNLQHIATTVCSGGTAVLTGQRLNTIQGVQVGDKQASYELLENGNLSYSLAGIAPGTYQVRLSVPISSLVLTSQIQVTACDSPVVEAGLRGKVNVGSFNGKLVVYAAGLEGKRISWKVGGRWGRAVANSSFARFDRPTPRRGVEVNVEVFVDGVSQLTKRVVTR